MSAPATSILPESVSPKRRAYDPNNLHPLDAESRKYDDTSEGIDWDEIIATTQDDFLAGRFAFNSAEYPTHEAAMAALETWMDSILNEVLDEAAAASARDVEHLKSGHSTETS